HGSKATCPFPAAVPARAPRPTTASGQHMHPRFLRRIVPGTPLCVKRTAVDAPTVRAKTTFVAGGDRTMTACAIEPSTGHDEAAGDGGDDGDAGHGGTAGAGPDGVTGTDAGTVREAATGGTGGADGAGGTVGAVPPGCSITADGAYAARLARSGDNLYPERWTLDGPEPYAVPLAGHQPEEPGTEVQPLSDGRVLLHRLVDGRHTFCLLYPTGPGTGELPLGAVECPEAGTRVSLLPPAPCGERAYAVAV